MSVRSLAMRSRPNTPMSKPASTGEGEVLTKLEQRIGSVIREIDRADGRKETLEKRMEVLTDEVGRAKGRQQIKPEADAFLEELQAELHRKAVGSYERLLTAIAQDVLKADNKIGLDLYTDRGLPALDIFIDADGFREDIINGAGGSMTNVISLGLRMIATVRSGMRKFVALDEPDCWLAPSKVTNFYRVIDDLGDKLSVQSLIISHHDLELMPEGFAVAKFYKDGDRVICQNDPKAASWADDQVGIRSLRMVNFMSHEDTEVQLSPGATAIIGDNHLGKSVAVRAFRAVAYGEVSDADIKHGAKSVAVELEIEGERIVRLTRQPGRNPINEWTLEDKAGNILQDEANGTEFRTGGRSVPAWVIKHLGIDRFEGLEHQLSHQKFPVFLLGETPSKRASVLSIGRESGYIQKMISRQRDNGKADSTLIKNGEIEVARIQAELQEMEVFEQLGEDLHALKDRLPEIKNEISTTTAVHETINRLQRIEEKIQVLQPVQTVLRDFNLDLPNVSAGIQERANLEELGARLSNIGKRYEVAEKRRSALGDALSNPPSVEGNAELEQMIARLQKVDTGLASANKAKASLDAEFEVATTEMDALIEELGGECPICGSSISHKHIVAKG